MEKKFLYVNKQELNNVLSEVESALVGFKPFFDKAKEIGINSIKSENLDEFFRNPKSYFLQTLTKGQTLKVGDLELDSAKVYDLATRPDGLDELVTKIEGLKIDNIFVRHYFRHLPNLAVVENELIIDPKFIEDQTEIYTVYADTENRLKALALIKNISAELTVLKSIQKHSPGSGAEWFDKIFSESYSDATISPKLSCITNF